MANKVDNPLGTNRTLVTVGLGLMLFFAAVYCHQKHFASYTPVSRLDLLHALLAGTVQIDAYHTNTPDKAVFEGHYYSDKAPGTVAVALPAFAAATGWLRITGEPLESPKAWLFTSWVACAGSNGLFLALGGMALFSWLLRYVPPWVALVTSLTIFLGAAPLPYATMMFSHTLVVGLLAIVLWAIQRQTEEYASRLDHREVMPLKEKIPSQRWDLLAGFAAGCVLASEYTAGLVVVGIFAGLLSLDWRRSIPFCCALLLPAMSIPAYSYACFGKPLLLPYSLQASFPAMKQGLYAIQWPDPATAINLLFLPLRGLYFWTPFLLMALIGCKILLRTNQRLFWLTYLIPMLQIIVISGRRWDWQAGPTFGPRYLAPILPLLALPCALGLQRFRILGCLLGGYSILITSLATLTDACTEYSVYNPLTGLYIPLFLNGQFSPNLGMALGLSPYLSIALFYGILIGGVCWLVRAAGPKQWNSPEGKTLLAPSKTEQA